MREKPRPRRRVSPAALRLLTPLFRYSAARDAYVLRVAGGQYGPALVDKTITPAPDLTAEPAATGRFARRGQERIPEAAGTDTPPR